MNDPLVAIVTPVFDGADSLAGCIESVLAQTYSDWTWVIADNASGDETLGIAMDAAQRDPRIRVERHPQHLEMLPHWNRALSCVPDSASYVKQLNVDDRLRPDCLARLVAIAEKNPGAAVVSSYFQYGKDRLPALDADDVELFPGRDVVRKVLFGDPAPLAHPSVMLLRPEAAPQWPMFFDARCFPPAHPLHPPLGLADKEAYFDALERFDVAFVPELLTDVSKNEESATAFSERVGAWHPGRLETILRHGERFLGPADRLRALRRTARRYLRSLLWRVCKGAAFRDRELREYQQLAFAHLLPQLEGEAMGWEGTALRWAGRLFAG